MRRFHSARDPKLSPAEWRKLRRDLSELTSDLYLLELSVKSVRERARRIEDRLNER